MRLTAGSPSLHWHPAKMLKNGKETISHMLYHIFKTSFDSGDIPELLKISYIIPIHKGGSKA